MSKWLFPRVIAHRGGGIFAPENTINAIETGVKYGFKAVEFDVMLSKDLVPFLMHDEVLARTVRDSQFCNKLLSEVNSADVTNIDAGSWFDENIKDVKIPSFREVIQYCSDHGIWMNIEIKPVEGFDEITGQVVAEMVNTYFPSEVPVDNYKTPLFSSFSFESLLKAKDYAPHIPRGYLIESLRHVPDWKQRMEVLQAVAVHTDFKYLTAEDIAEIKECGYGLFCYTVNDRDKGDELFALGVDAFCTDRLDLFAPGK